jgi:hypothetical protein
MTESAGLERRYRRLLAAYPQSFRREQEDEVLAVLLGLLVVLCYPAVAQLVALSVPNSTELMGLPTNAHLTVLYLPPLLMLAGIMIVACTGPRLRAIRQLRQPGSA